MRRHVQDLLFRISVLRRIGIVGVEPPHRMVRALGTLVRWGPGLPSAVDTAAARHPRRRAVVDELGELTWGEVREQVDRLATAFRERGVGPGDGVALLCRNNRWFLLSLVALMKVGARALLMNTMANPAQVAELVEREGARLLVVDEEFVPEALDADRVVLAWSDDDHPELPTIASWIAAAEAGRHRKPPVKGAIVIFTSGTTGAPKGARRGEPDDLDPLVTFFGAIPYRKHATVVLAAPMFHSWGLLNLGFALSTVPTLVLRRRFDPAQTVRDVAEHRADVLVAVPLMLQRMVALPPEATEGLDVSSLEVTACSGSALTGDVATRFMDRFTDSIHNFYGSTETGWVSIASPADLRAAPGTAGHVPWRTVVKVLDDEGREVPAGTTGTIYVGNELQFDGYTDGNSKDVRDGLMHSGDVGHFDEAGRLFVEGRDDDMVVSGGENVFPSELEDALARHPGIADVVVTGAPHPDFGQCLVAHVVRAPGADLDEESVQEFAKGAVARFAVPQAVQFLDELPRNATGKVVKRDLPEVDPVAS